MRVSAFVAFGFAWTAGICLLLAGGQAAAIEKAELAAATRSITPDELKRHVDVLSDDSFEGREAGSRGGRAAGNYLWQHFERNGLRGIGDNGSFFQSFNSSARNIVGLLEGSDPELKREIVLIGAHYDHVGYGKPNNSYGPWGYIHNGADDNASGVAGLLEVLDAVKQLPSPPKRSILFALWDGEEQGLLGSQHWTANPTLPLDRIVLAINLDMIGRLRNGKVEVIGSRSGSGLRRLVSEANREAGQGTPLDLDFTYKLKADSDHWPFFARSIPILMFHTGLHGDYHRPSDDAHRINVEGIGRVGRLVLHTVMLAAEAGQEIPFRSVARQETEYHQAAIEQPIPQRPPQFGMSFKQLPGEETQLVVTVVTRGSPAERGGLKEGDRLVSFQGMPIKDEARFRLELLASSGETTLVVERADMAEPVALKITPQGGPVRVGISWRIDEAEPDVVVLTQVVNGSPAQAAGLALRDRIYSVNGERFIGSDQFARLLRSTSSPLEMEVERQGRLQTLSLHLLENVAAAE